MKAVVPASELFGRITVNLRVTGLQVALFRMRVAIWLFGLAARIGGVGLSVDADEGKP